MHISACALHVWCLGLALADHELLELPDLHRLGRGPPLAVDLDHRLATTRGNELDRLDTAWDLTTSSRLGCQAVIKGDVVAEFPMYTRNYVQEGGAIQLGKSEEQGDRDKDRDGART